MVSTISAFICVSSYYLPATRVMDTDVQLSELTTQLSETIGQAETRARDEGRLRSELRRLQITAARYLFGRVCCYRCGAESACWWLVTLC